MTLNQVSHGFFGGLIGFAFSGPLVLHQGWMSMAKLREENRTARTALYTASFIMLPLLMFMGIIGSPLVGAYAAYRCGKEGSLDPLIQTIKAPYQDDESVSRYELNTSRGMLIGYSTVLTLLSFTLFNMLTGNVFGFLGAPGAAILSAFIPASSSFAASTFMSMTLCYLGGLFGAGSAACYTAATPSPRLSERSVFHMNNDYVPVANYELMDDEPDDLSSTNGFTRESVVTVEDYTQAATTTDIPFKTTQGTMSVFSGIPRLQTILHRWDNYWNNATPQSTSPSEMQTFSSSYAEFSDDSSEDPDDTILFQTPSNTPPQTSPSNK